MCRRSLRFALAVAVVMAIMACVGCRHKGDSTDSRGESLPDTLRIGTLYSPISYFIYRDEPMGYDYEMALKFAADHKIPAKVSVATNPEDLVKMLEEGKIDLIAYGVPQTAEYNRRMRHCGHSDVSYQVLVQQENDSVDDVTDLVGREVTIEANSRYLYRLRNLSDELGGGIKIKTLSRDTLICEDMVQMVSDGDAALTVIDSETAKVLKEYYPDLDMHLKVSLDQSTSWAVGKENVALAEMVDQWWKSQDTAKDREQLYKKYYATEKQLFAQNDLIGPVTLMKNGDISPYDAYFKKYSPLLGWDWRMVAAVGYTESHFIPDIRSWAGACGVMQLMPGTAAHFGVRGNDIYNPALNIEAGVRLLKHLDDSFRSEVPDPEERRRMVLASYNSGQGHILDAMALAKKYGDDPGKWYGHVDKFLKLKSKAEYYNDPVVKSGYFNAKETLAFVDKVEALYDRYRAATTK